MYLIFSIFPTADGSTWRLVPPPQHLTTDGTLTTLR
jgi:hypothetical protein